MGTAPGVTTGAALPSTVTARWLPGSARQTRSQPAAFPATHLQRLAHDISDTSVLQHPRIHALLQPAAQHLQAPAAGAKQHQSNTAGQHRAGLCDASTLCQRRAPPASCLRWVGGH
jgi:hypothetical protein